MENILISPGKYIQGSGAFRGLGEHVKKFGDRALIIVDSFVLKSLNARLHDAMAPVATVVEQFGGEASKREIDRLKAIGDREKVTAVVGVGGGKTLDTAKAVAYSLKRPLVVVPTIAATDAPTSALSVIYTDEGVFEEYLILPKNPDLVLVDTQIVAEAPVRFLVSGMGDALATWFEADAASRSASANMPGGRPTAAALALAKLCYDTLLEYGLSAKLAVEKHVVTPAVERIVEANTLLSGLGFESGGLAAAHAIHNGFTVIHETHERYHGEKVAFSTIVQLVMEDRYTDEIEEVLEFCEIVGLPTTLADLGIDHPEKDALMRAAQSATAEGETIHNMPFPVTAEMVYSAIVGADAIGKQHKQ